MRELEIKNKIKKVLPKLKQIKETEFAEDLVFFTMNHESGFFNYRRQNVSDFNIKRHAIGLIQMEYSTFISFYENWLIFRPHHLAYILSFSDKNEWDLDLFRELEYNDELAIAVCRYYYFSKPESLPSENQLKTLAYYWKKHWNSELGKGTEDKFINDSKITIKKIWRKI